MRISDWSSDVCSSDLRPHSRHAKVVPRSDSRCRCNSCGDLLVSRCWLPKRHGSVTPRPSRSEEHTSALQSLMRISYAVFFLKKKTQALNGVFGWIVDRTLHEVVSNLLVATNVDRLTQEYEHNCALQPAQVS